MSWEFFDPENKIRKHGRKLPHWQQGEVMQFVTFRLGDSMPMSRLNEWRQERKVWMIAHPKPWDEETWREYHLQFTDKIERWLDEGMGSCLLRDLGARDTLEKVLMKYQGERVDHLAWVIMPNHVHLLFVPKEELPELMRAWKGVSAKLIGKGEIWQANYRDTLIRSARHFAAVVRYIRMNPVKSRLREGEFTLWESERAMGVE